MEARNSQQVEVLRAFEEKCRRLYDTRLQDYIAKTDEQMSSYEDKLLESAGQARSISLYIIFTPPSSLTSPALP